MKKVKQDVRIVPTGVKVLAVLGYIGAGFLILFGLLSIIFASFMSSFVAENAQGELALSTGFFLIIGIFLLLMGAVNIFISRGLWKGRNWARIVIIIFSIIGFVSAILSLFMGDLTSIISLVINGIVAAYLLFNKKVNKCFS